MKRIDQVDETTNETGAPNDAENNNTEVSQEVETGKEIVEEQLAEHTNATEQLEAAAATPPKVGRFSFDINKVASTRKGAKVRTNIFYEVIGVPGANIKMQPQKALCLQLVNANTSDDNPRISEPDLKAILEAAKADGTLDTTQEAWRIFAYYKGELVEEGYLAEHNIKQTATPVAKAS